MTEPKRLSSGRYGHFFPWAQHNVEFELHLIYKRNKCSVQGRSLSSSDPASSPLCKGVKSPAIRMYTQTTRYSMTRPMKRYIFQSPKAGDQRDFVDEAKPPRRA